MEDTLIKELSKLNQSEKIDQVAVPNHHITILEERLKTLDEDGAKGRPWSIIRGKYL